MVTIYTKDNCIQCKMTIREMNNLNISFNEKNLDSNPHLITFVKEVLGYQSAPVIITDKENWFGFKPDKIANIVK